MYYKCSRCRAEFDGGGCPNGCDDYDEEPEPLTLKSQDPEGAHTPSGPGFSGVSTETNNTNLQPVPNGRG